MFLKSLEIKGFKSFADRTEFIFEPGVTVIVGPNGSGKSNLVDAVTWVLGAQGAKALRGQKMEDVIFAGSRQRSALGRASVMLTIDNAGGALPIDFVEVTICRTLYRSGESEYSINGAPCRLLDIQELLSDTGVGRQLHTIVGQGQLDTILSARSEDRRAVIEEAAGILKFRKRKEKALRRLGATEGNLTRLQDVVRELNRQLRPLEKQAEAARRHESVAERLNAIRWYVCGRDYARLVERQSSLTARLEHARVSLAGSRQRLVEHEAVIAQLDAELASARTDTEDLSDLRRRIDIAGAQLNALADVAEERVRSYRARASSPEALSFDFLEAESERIAIRLAEADGALLPVRDRSAAAIERERISMAERDAVRIRYGEFAGEAGLRIAEMVGERNGIEAALTRSETEAGRLVERRRSNEARLHRVADERERLTAEIERLDSEATPLAGEVERLSTLRDSLRTEISTLEDDRRRSESEFATWSGRLEALRIAAEEAQAANGGRKVADNGGPGVVGVVSELITTDDGMERAVEAALGELIDAVIVTSPDAVYDAVVSLKADDGGIATFVEPDGLASFERGRLLETPGMGEARPILASVRSARDDETAIGNFLRAALSATYVVSSWRAAWDLSRRYPDVTFVTEEGDRLNGDRSWRAGSGIRGALQRAASLSEIAEMARRADRDLNEITRSLDRRREELETISGELGVLESALFENDAMLTAAAGQLGRLDPETVDLETESGVLDEAEAELADRIARDRDRTAEIDHELSIIQSGDDEALRSEEEARAAIDEAEAILEAASKERNDAGIALAQAEERVAILRSRLAEIDVELAAERDSVPARAAEREALLVSAGSAEVVASAARASAARAAELVTGVDTYRASFSINAESIGTQMSEARAGAAAARDDIAKLADDERTFEVESAAEGVKLEQVVASMSAEFGRDPAESQTAQLPEGLAEADAKGEAGALEREIKQMGPVNPLALEEYEQLSQRIEFVRSQLEDLKASRRDLQKIIRAVDNKIVEIFTEAFTDVAAHFEQIFGRMFPGGAGRIRLSDPSDLLDTGVDVDARPSGKNVRKLSLLSGGERSMTALAFLFAVFRARPSPFYLLDEVEAALDDANLHRFLDLVNEFRAESQFVLITHQKRSMEVADSLYGVSMQGTGVSKVISQKMADPALL